MRVRLGSDKKRVKHSFLLTANQILPLKTKVDMEGRHVAITKIMLPVGFVGKIKDSCVQECDQHNTER